MAKSKLSEKYSLNVEGVLGIELDEENETSTITVDVEEVGTKNLAELLKKFDKECVKISVSYSNEVE
jgi:hypothetical protein